MMLNPKNATNGPPEYWEKFLAARYEGGTKKVPNPNFKTRDKYPQVTLYTAIKQPIYMKKIMEEYHQWVQQGKQKAPINNAEPKTE